MSYRILETAVHKFEVIEEGYKPLHLAVCATLAEAQEEVKSWEARDNLQDIISDFIDEQIDNFGTVLVESEIREMISEVAKD